MNSRLLEPELLERSGLAQARMFALEDAGLLACSPPDEQTLQQASERAVRLLNGSVAFAEWQRAIAAELFLLSQWDTSLAARLAGAAQVLATVPLPGGPSLREVFGRQSAFAIAPLDVASGARFLQVWAVRKGDESGPWSLHPCPLEGAAGFFSGGWHLAAIPPIMGTAPKWPVGPSWKLAAALAQHVVADPGPRHEWVQRLALDWIATGDIAADNIEWVDIKEKRLAAREDTRRRRWLAPSASAQGDDFVLLREELPGRLCAAADLREAWAYFTGGGFIETREAKPWPEEVPVFHAFVSDALGPIVAPLLLQRTERAVFWVSKEKEAFFGAIEEFVRIARDAGLVAKDLTLERIPVRAASFEEAETCLVSVLDLVASSQSVQFNITGGNLPLRLALAELARSNPNLRLIYRPESEESTNHYLGLHFPYRLPRTRRLEPRDHRADTLINLRLGPLTKQWELTTRDAFVRWCEENLPQIAAACQGMDRPDLVANKDRNHEYPSMTTSHLFSFAAKSLQAYIMRGGKLRDMVGATSLIDKLADAQRLTELLEDTFGIPQERFEILQAAAGGARIKFLEEEDARSVHRAWPLWCRAWAPDLEMVQDLRLLTAPFIEVSYAASAALERERNFTFARLPEPGPWVQRAPRTGEPAVSKDTDLDELIDEATRRKRDERDALKKASELPSAIKAFGFDSVKEIPTDFEKVSGDERAYLAVIHADGNKLGQMFIDVVQALKEKPLAVDDAAIDLMRHLSSNVVAEGTREAVRKTMKKLRMYVLAQRESDNAQRAAVGKPSKPEEAWPFAPIVLAGDDVTLVCRADLGISFAEEFLGAFRAEMADRLHKMQGEAFWTKLPPHVRKTVPSGLSAGAGIVFCSNHYPFSLAYELCESLAKQAKDAAKKKGDAVPPSALSFVRITGASAPTEFDDLAEGILHGADGTLLTGCPYYVDSTRVPQLKDLRAVATVARSRKESDASGDEHRAGLPSSTLRELLHLQQTDPASVEGAVQRMLDVASDKGDRAKDFIAAWTQLTGHSAEADPPDWHHLRFFDAARSPLLDVLTLHAVKCAPELKLTPSTP